MEEQCLVHQYLQLYTTADKFYLKPATLCCISSEVLTIDRVSGEATVQDLDLIKLLGDKTDYRLIFGLLGSIKLVSGCYLVIVTDRLLLSKINGHTIFQVTNTEIIPYARSTTHLTNQQMEDNKKYERMIQLMLEQPGLYFSCSYDLTQTVHKLHSVAPAFYKKPLTSRADTRFLWNRHLLKEFTDERFGHFTLPLIQGFVSINHVTVNGHKVVWSLVSRRSADRAGPKLFMRGIDDEGNAANHVITEQIIEYNDKISSFLLTRGSVPLPWTQYPDLTLLPAMKIAKGDHVTTFMKHLKDQQLRYGDVVCVNLINQHGQEGALEAAFRAAATKADLRSVKYCHFDFHAHCSFTQYDRLNILLDNIDKELKEFSYFFSEDGTVVQRQSGTFRVNCLDSLDRTNVVQSILANVQLKNTLKQMTVVTSDDEQLEEFEKVVNNTWADHADMIAIQYSGTGALKTEFTRTGKRTYMGVASDVINAFVRYYINNFSDGFKQDAFDVFLGNYVVPDSKSNKHPISLSECYSWKQVTLPTTLLAAVCMFCASIFLSDSFGTEMLLYLMFWGTIAVTTLRYIFKNGKEFVDWPILCAGEPTLSCKPKSL